MFWTRNRCNFFPKLSQNVHWQGSQSQKDHLHIFRLHWRVSPCHKYHRSICIIAINAWQTERWGGAGRVGTKNIGNNQPARISPWQAMNAFCAVRDRRARDRTILANKRSYITPLEIGLSSSSTSSSWTKMGKHRSLFSALLRPIPAGLRLVERDSGIAGSVVIALRTRSYLITRLTRYLGKNHRKPWFESLLPSDPSLSAIPRNCSSVSGD